MPDTKISAAAGETGGVAETADLLQLFQRKDGLWATPFSAIPPSAPVTPSGQVSSYSGAAGNSTAGGGGLLSSLNAQALTTLQGGVVPGSVLTAASTVANTSAETQLLGLSIPAADPVAGAIYRIVFGGVYSDTGTPTLAFGLRYGGAAGTSIAAMVATTLGSSITGVPFEGEVILQFWSTVLATGKIRIGLGTSASAGTTTPLTASAVAAGVTVASSTAKVMSLTVTWSAASSSNTISALTGYGERIA
jgi:hypothetical protein